MNRLAGKVAIITGGAGGLGSACVERFAAEGTTVVLADIVDEASRFISTAATRTRSAKALRRSSSGSAGSTSCSTMPPLSARTS